MTLLPPTTPHPYLSPRQLQVASYLYGLETPELSTATVLELGCEQGQNLLAFAYSNPNAQAIGIDIDTEIVSLGQQQLIDKEIENIELHTLNLAQLIQTDLPLCDYIIIRGLFAQTDLETRLQLLQHCHKFLSPNGVIVIQHAVYPGSKALDGVFDSLALHSAQSAAEPEQQLQALRAMLGFMAEGMNKNSGKTVAIQHAIEQLEQQNDHNLYLSALGGLHNPCYFIEFASQLEAVGLCYVGDADPASELPERLGDMASTLTKLINPSKNKILTQQYLDTLTQRTYRYSLLSHNQHAEIISALPDTTKVADLHWAGYFQPNTNNDRAQDPIFETQSGDFLQTPHLISQHIFYALSDTWPYSLDIKTLARQTAPVVDLLDDIDNPVAHKKVAQTLEQIFIYSSRHIFLSKQPGPYNTLNEKNITITPLKKLQYGENPTYINLWNQNINFKLSLKDEKIEINSIDDINYINELNKNALLFGNYQSWRKYYLQAFKFFNDTNESKNDIKLLLAKLINFSFYEEIFINKEKKISKPPVILNRNLKFITSSIKEEREIFLKKINNSKLSNEEKSYAFYLYAKNKFDYEKITDTYILNKCIEVDPYNYFYYVFFLYTTIFNEENYSWILRKFFVLASQETLLLSSISNDFTKSKNFFNSEIIYKKIKDIIPNDVLNKSNLAVVLSEQGKVDEAIKEFENILDKIEPEQYSIYLFISLHSNYYNTEQLFNAHYNYGKIVEKWAAQQKWQSKPFKIDNNRPLRIGFVSGDLRNHSVARFLLPYWDGLDKSKFEIYAYCIFNKADEVTQHLKEKTKKWINAYSLSLVKLAETIRNDEIDILIDLSGHTGYNRLPTFALKPAPVQMSWIGYPATTGLEAMDYYLTYTDFLALTKLSEQFTEKFLYLDLEIPFDSAVHLPNITKELPVQKNGYFTFASFCRSQKISKEVLKIWAEIMQLCPDDRLLIANIYDDETILSFKETLLKYGAKEDQLIFRKRVKIEKYLEMHNEVDLLLDAFPYVGGTTFVHAISMGLPTLTLSGNKMHDSSPFFARYGLEDFMASNIENYKAKALLHKERTDVLLDLRHSLREKLSGLHKDPTHSVRVFERGLLYAWENYCEGNTAISKKIN